MSPLITIELIHQLKVSINLTILRAFPLLHFIPCTLIASMSFNIMEGQGATYKFESGRPTIVH